MGPKLAEFLLEGDRSRRPAIPGVRAILYRGYQTRERRENSASNRRHGDRSRESDAGSNRSRTFPLNRELACCGWPLAVYSWRLPLAVVGSRHLVVLRGRAT